VDHQVEKSSSTSKKYDYHERPLVATLGTVIYVICSKCSDVGPNAMWTIDTASKPRPQWQPLSPPSDLQRFDPISAFAHSGALYLIGWQAAIHNFAYRFDPRSGGAGAGLWTILCKNVSGQFVAGTGVLLRKQFVNKTTFFCESRSITSP
jgi:hypothetical protein